MFVSVDTALAPFSWEVRLPLDYFWLLRALNQWAHKITVLFGIIHPKY